MKQDAIGELLVAIILSLSGLVQPLFFFAGGAQSATSTLFGATWPGQTSWACTPEPEPEMEGPPKRFLRTPMATLA